MSSDLNEVAEELKRAIVHYINNQVDIPYLNEKQEEELFTLLVDQLERQLNTNTSRWAVMLFPLCVNLFLTASLKMLNII